MYVISTYFCVLFHSDYYLSIFSVLGFGQVFSAIFAFLFLVLATIKGSRTIHSKMLTNILHSPMSFFDTTPLGRIMNRFSKDIYNIDEVIPISIDDFLASFFMVVSVILVVTISTPIFVVVILPLGIFYWFVQVCRAGAAGIVCFAFSDLIHKNFGLSEQFGRLSNQAYKE